MTISKLFLIHPPPPKKKDINSPRKLNPRAPLFPPSETISPPLKNLNPLQTKKLKFFLPPLKIFHPSLKKPQPHPVNISI